MSDPQFNPSTTPTQAPKLLDRLRARLQRRGFGLDVQNHFVEWCRQFIVFHHLRHPADMGAAKVGQFLGDLAARRLPMQWRREAWEPAGFSGRGVDGRDGGGGERDARYAGGAGLGDGFPGAQGTGSTIQHSEAK